MLADTDSVSGIPEFLSLLEKHNKKAATKILPIVGCHLSTTNGREVVIAKNHAGWLELLKCVSYVNTSGKAYTGDFSEYPNLYRPSASDLSHIVYYAKPEDVLYQQIIVCITEKTTLKDRMVSEDNQKFFADNFVGHLVCDENLPNWVGSLEYFSVAAKPRIPKCIENGAEIDNADVYLLNLCRNGWKLRGLHERLKHNLPLQKVYAERVKEEIGVMQAANICNYMLLVRDFISYSTKQGKSVGLRGSAVGCLVSYLTGICDVDPICPDPALAYDAPRSLVFSRFINKARFAGSSNSLPDVDMDFHPSIREDLKTWIAQKYGVERCAEIMTFQKMKGAAVIKDVFRVLGKSYDVANTITKEMVNEAQVQDELADIQADDPAYNIIDYCIDNVPVVHDAYTEYKFEMDIARKLTNTIRGHGRHAGGLVVGDIPLSEFLPVLEQDGRRIIMLDKVWTEYCGGVKFDLLGVSAIEKIDNMMEMING
jgi:DNA polymerase III alpha subunit